jgi:GTP-binding protein HflX
LDKLKQAIAQHVSTERLEVTIKLQPSDARLRGLLYDLKAVIDETVDDHGNMQLALNIALSDWRRLEQNIQISLDDYIV